MKFNNIIKVTLAAIAVVSFSFSADAQFGNLGNKIKNKAKQAVDNKVQSAKNQVENKVDRTIDNAVDKAVNTATNEAKKQLNMAVEYKTQLNAPDPEACKDIDELYDAFEYWATLQEMANKKKDVEWLCSDKGEQMGKVFNMIANDNSKDVARWHSWSTAQERMNGVAKATREILYAGYPKAEDFNGNNNAYLAAALKWYVDKAKKGKKNAKQYYTSNGAATRYLAFCTDRYTDDEAIEKQTKELRKLYDQMDEAYKAKYPNANPYMTYEEVKADMKASQERAAKAKAEKEAKRKAEIEASKQTLKPGALNKSMNAQVLKVAKAKFKGVIKVVVENDSWTVKREGGTIARRTLLAWVVTKDEEGNLVAHDYGFAQEYLGGGKYDSLRHYSVGLRTVYVK
ncbi:MAG: hypothetical protein MJZ74_04465 [Muribaculaceae bacterium]|nr:hypothetical protein [Muribaculaceae bacterium]